MTIGKENGIYHIAIDGPVASGKGTIAKELGRRLGIGVLDTGAMYRGVGLYILDKKIDITDVDSVKVAVEKLDMKVEITQDLTRIFIDGQDVTNRLRTSEVGQMASLVYPYARDKMTELMRALASGQSLILDGRDIASHVLPRAKYKFYLTACVRVRAQRRLAQLNDGQSLEDVILQIKIRDKRDKTRKLSPLKQVKDAVVIDNSNLTQDETIARMLEAKRKIV